MSLDFHQISLADKPLVERYRAAWDMESSEYTFTNLLIWGTDGRIWLAEQNDVMFTLLTYGKETPFMFAPLPLNQKVDYPQAIRAAEEHFAALGVSPRFVAIAGPLHDLFVQHCPQYQLNEDRGNFDYVYAMEDLLNLRGKKLHSKRNHINQFRAAYSFEYVELDESMKKECLQVYLHWLERKDAFQPGVLGELAAIETLMSNMQTLKIRGGGIRVDGVMVAFTLGEQIRNDMALIHIEKADPNIIGLYAMINQQFIEHAWTHVSWINREEDMGLEGLRRAKLSYHPAKLIEKYEAVRNV